MIWARLCDRFGFYVVFHALINIINVYSIPTIAAYPKSCSQASGTRGPTRIRRAPGASRVNGLPEIPVPDQT